MNFFNSIERGFQDFGNIINNEVIQPAGDALDPTKNGFIHTFDLSTNGFINTFDPHKGKFNMRFDPNNVSGVILNYPNIRRITNDQNIKRAIKTTSIDDALNQIKNGFQKDVIDGFQKDVIDGFQKDIINPSKAVFDNIGDTINSLGGGGGRTQTPTAYDNTTLYIIIGTVLVGKYGRDLLRIRKKRQY